MKPSRNACVVAALSLAALWVLFRLGRTGDLVLGSVEVSAIVLMSVAVLIRLVRRRGKTGGYGQDAVMPGKLRRWVMDDHEPQPPAPSPRR